MNKKQKILYKKIIRYAYFVCLLAVTTYGYALAYQLETAKAVEVVEVNEGTGGRIPDPCSLNVVDCKGEAKAPHSADGGSTWASVTAYSSIDSCHTGVSCLMANGKKAHLGAIACPRSVKLGTRVTINGTTYTCADRTARWVDGRYDIFMGYGQEAYDAAIKFGNQRLIISLGE